MQSDRPPLIVLRFRDIELPSGETIARHRGTIGMHRYCWWGWLFREYERNPHLELDRLTAQLGEPPFDVALLDTGRGLVFRGACHEVRSHPRPQRSPEVGATPDYYNHRRAPAWFRFTQIDDADESLVVGKECILLPSASGDCYVDILGKTVQRIGDLRRQEVTMWVLA